MVEKTAIQKVFEEAFMGLGGDFGGSHLWYNTKIDKTGKKLYRLQVAAYFQHVIPLQKHITPRDDYLHKINWYMRRSKYWDKKEQENLENWNSVMGDLNQFSYIHEWVDEDSDSISCMTLMKDRTDFEEQITLERNIFPPWEGTQRAMAWFYLQFISFFVQ
jgi:hypothetical protein